MPGVSGYVDDFEVCGGQSSKGPPENMKNGQEYGEMECVILRLTQVLEPGKHYAFFDNLFASPEVMMHLKDRDIFPVATLRADRIRECQVTSESALKRKGKGTMEQFADKQNGVVITAWYDNIRVIMVSNFLGKDPEEEAKSYDKKNK